MRLADRFHAAVGRRIGPTFDALESIQAKHDWTILPMNLALAAAFPAWMLLADAVDRARRF